MTQVAASAEPLPSADRDDYSITQLCAEFGVTARALRFYEDEGLISPQRRGPNASILSGTAHGSPGYCGASGSGSASPIFAR